MNSASVLRARHDLASQRLPRNIVVAEGANELFVYDMKPADFAKAVSFAQEQCRRIWGVTIKLRGEPLLLAMKAKRGFRIWRSDEPMVECSTLPGTPRCLIEAAWYDGTARVGWSAPAVQLGDTLSPFEFVFKDMIAAAEKRAARYWTEEDFPKDIQQLRAFDFQFSFQEPRLWIGNKDGSLWEDQFGDKSFFAEGRNFRCGVSLLDGWGPALRASPESAVLAWVKGLRIRALREEAAVMRLSSEALSAASLELQAQALEDEAHVGRETVVAVA